MVSSAPITDLGIPERPMEIATQIATEVKRRFGDEVQMIWYGSWVKGTARPHSDLDLAVHARQPIPHHEMVALRDWVDELRTLYSVDLVDLDEVGPDLRHQIVREGVPL
ncbi:MAG: nucleotidyltransferase family protein [Gammaproteobacteria bacterium]